MLNIFADVFTTATKTNTYVTPLGEDERYNLLLEQNRRERRLARLKADQRFYRQA